MNLFAAALLGIVQGLTEFLPVSSSAHLILARAFFGWDAERSFGLAFDVACHVGTLAAVLVFFRDDIRAMLRGAAARFHAVAGSGGAENPADRDRDGADRGRRARSTPTRSRRRCARPLVAAIALIVGAGLLLVIERLSARARRARNRSRPPGALAIGAAQAVALVPGVSRSGATIVDGDGARAAARSGGAVRLPDEHAGDSGRGRAKRRSSCGTSRSAPTPAAVRRRHVDVGRRRLFHGEVLHRFLVSHRLDVFAWYRVALAAATFVWLAAR